MFAVSNKTLNASFFFSQAIEGQQMIESKSSIKMSPSIDFFMLYVNSSSLPSSPSMVLANLDKEWYYNIVRSACCFASSENTLIPNNVSLKSRQCALMLANLDYSNAISILGSKDFKISILKDCLLLGAQRTQSSIQKLPSALKHASANSVFEKDFMHPLWLAGSNLLFDILNDLCMSLPKPPLVTLNTTVPSCSIYDSKLDELDRQYDFYSFINPLTEAINAYLKCIRQYPSLQHQLRLNEDSATSSNTKSTPNSQKINDLITYIIFQLGFVNFISNKLHRLLTTQSINQSFMCLFNLLVDNTLLNSLCARPNYSTLVSSFIKDFYNLVSGYFLKPGDENLIHIPNLSNRHIIEYTQNYTNDVLFNTVTFELMLKIRFLVISHKWNRGLSGGAGGGGDSGGHAGSNESSMNAAFSVSSSTHRYLQCQSHLLRERIPFHIRDLIEKIYLSMCRLPVIDRFVRIPDVLWRTSGFRLEYGQFLKDDPSSLPPLDYLRDAHVLKEHLRYILSVGWTSRTQFEYEYVNLLTLLHNLSDDIYFKSETGAPLPTEEVRERNKCVSLVIKGLSSWLVKSTLTPKSGCSLNSLYEQVSRNKVPSFLLSQLGKQYSQVKRVIDSHNREMQFTKMNSICISNNTNLLHMLDPTLIDEATKDKQRSARLDFTQPQPTVNALHNLFQISTSLNQRDHSLLFSANIERTMLANLPTNSDTYFHFSQVSLEGLLKFLGIWNKSNVRQRSSSGGLFSNLVNAAGSGTVVDEVQQKTANAINNLIKVCFLKLLVHNKTQFLRIFFSKLLRIYTVYDCL